MPGNADLPHPGGRGLGTKRIVLPVEEGPHFKPRSGGCGADKLQDLLVTLQWLARPVSADGTEQTALDGIVFRRSGRIMGHGNGEPSAVAELLKLILPGATRGRVASAGVGQDEQAFGVRVALPSFAERQARMEDTAKAEVS